LGIIEDVTRAVTLDWKAPGDIVYLLGETRAELGGSHLSSLDNDAQPGTVPGLAEHAPTLYRACHRAMQEGLVRACHDLSEGGLAVAAAEMCIAGRRGCALEIQGDDPVIDLFSESNGRLLIEVRPVDCAAFEAYFRSGTDSHVERIGMVTQDDALTVVRRGVKILELQVAALVEAWNGDRDV
jgi:phosphoribosylformylglycinamidine synthase